MREAGSRHDRAITTGGVLLAALLCSAGAFQSYRFESAFQQSRPDRYRIAARMPAFEPLLATLPPNAEAGFITDVRPGSDSEAFLFLSAQYLMAPRLLVRGASQEWVIGIFTRRTDFAAVGLSRGLQLQHDFGNGLVLFRRGR
jgi:hypothetical protein